MGEEDGVGRLRSGGKKKKDELKFFFLTDFLSLYKYLTSIFKFGGNNVDDKIKQSKSYAYLMSYE